MYELRHKAGLCSPLGCWLFMRSYRLFLRYAANRTGNFLCVSAERVSLGCGICHVTASGTSRPVCALVGLFQCCGFFLLVVYARTSIAPALGAGRRSRERSWRGKKRLHRTPFVKRLKKTRPAAEVIHSHPWGKTRKQSNRGNPACGGGHTFTPFRRHQGESDGEGWGGFQRAEETARFPALWPPSPARHVALCFEANLFLQKRKPYGRS